MLLILAGFLQGCSTGNAAKPATATIPDFLAETATARSAIATAEQYALPGQVVYGPENHELHHNPNDKQVATFEVEDERRDIVVEATFFAPYDGTEAAWDIGFIIRSTADDDDLRITLTSAGSWDVTAVTSGDPPTFVGVQSGYLPDLNSAAGTPITMRVVAQQDTGLLFIDGRFIARLDLSARTQAGSILVGTGYYTGDERENAVTVVENFRIWAISQATN